VLSPADIPGLAQEKEKEKDFEERRETACTDCGFVDTAMAHSGGTDLGYG
jgi:hypothetical protein